MARKIRSIAQSRPDKDMASRGKSAFIAPSAAIMIDQPWRSPVCGARFLFRPTIRIIADRLEIPIARLQVSARAEVDVRGTLLVDRDVPVGFQKMTCEVRVETAINVPVEKMRLLLAAAERRCVVLQTLRSGVQVQTQFDETQSLADLAAQ